MVLDPSPPPLYEMHIIIHNNHLCIVSTKQGTRRVGKTWVRGFRHMWTGELQNIKNGTKFYFLYGWKFTHIISRGRKTGLFKHENWSLQTWKTCDLKSGATKLKSGTTNLKSGTSNFKSGTNMSNPRDECRVRWMMRRCRYSSTNSPTHICCSVHTYYIHVYKYKHWLFVRSINKAGYGEGCKDVGTFW